MQRNLIILGVLFISSYFWWRSVGVYAMWAGAVFILAALWLRWGSRVTKLRLADKLLNSLPWRGDEMVLDVGCGHGLFTVYAAKRLKTGKAIGIDVWREFDQARNRSENVMDNAQIEGVGRFVEVKDGDAREIPFPGETFDIVVSGWAIHNIAVGTGREKAIREAYRVLKPGGWLGILDIEVAKECRDVMERLGMVEVRISGPSFAFIAPTSQLVGQKPERAEAKVA